MGDLDNTIDAKLFHKQHIWFLYGNVALSSYIRPNSSCIWHVKFAASSSSFLPQLNHIFEKDLQRFTWGAINTSIKAAPYIKEDIIKIQKEIGGPWHPIATPKLAR